MIFRQAKQEEISLIFNEGYKQWSKNRTFRQYCFDNGKEDVYGTRYIIEKNGEIVSSAIILNLKEIDAKKAYGIGSVLTPKIYSGNGYATELLKNCIKRIDEENALIFLHSEISTSFYKKFDFRILPSQFQKYKMSTCMVHCNDEIWYELINSPMSLIPDYF